MCPVTPNSLFSLHKGHEFMKNSNYLKFLVVFVTLLFATSENATSTGNVKSTNSEVKLLEKPVGKTGQTLVLVRGPDRSPSLFGFWKNAGKKDSTGLTALDQIKTFYELRLELHTPNQPNLIVASDLRIDRVDQKADQVTSVMSCEIRPEEINLVLAKGESICLWRVFLGDIANLSQPILGWTNDQVSYDITGSETTATIYRTKDDRFKLEIFEGCTNTFATFEQLKEDDLQLSKVLQGSGKPIH